MRHLLKRFKRSRFTYINTESKVRSACANAHSDMEVQRILLFSDKHC